MTDERGETPRPPEVPKQTPEPGTTEPIPEAVPPVLKPDSLLDRLQSEAARARGAKQSGKSGSSHT